MKKILSIVLVLATLFSIFSINVSAARQEEFLSDVALIYKDSVEEAKAAIAGTDWKLFERDLNPNADYMIDDGVYLIYKTSTNVEEAITDLRVMDMYGGYSTTSYKKQLEKSREQYMAMLADLRKATAEFKAFYEAGDGMAKLAYRQMNYYKDTKTAGGTETDMLMGDFLLNLPSDDKIVQVLMEGNTYIVSNLISLIAVGISGADGTSLAARIAEKYAIKDTLSDTDYHDSAKALATSFTTLKAKLLRYDTLKAEYNLNDDEMSEEEYSFVLEYATIAMLMEAIPYGDTTLAEFIKTEWETKDLYPIVAAFTPGQNALISMGQLETVLKYGSPSKPVDELTEAIEQVEKEMKDENNGVMPVYDVYTGVDREIFKGEFAMTSAAERHQALTGETWDLGDAASRSSAIAIAYIAASAVDAALAGITITGIVLNFKYSTTHLSMLAHEAWGAKCKVFASIFGESVVPYLVSTAALALIILGSYGISTWYNYYNPDYTAIPNTLIDVRTTDLGDQYVKYSAAKVFGAEEDMNADFNAYEGKEWIALYYTKDATAGNCLTANFVYKDSDSTIARRHQGIAMFGETEAFNLNSHVYNNDAPGVYVTMRYSNTKKAAADLPTVVGSMLSVGALYSLCAVGGVALGIGGTILVQKSKKKKDTPEEA